MARCVGSTARLGIFAACVSVGHSDLTHPGRCATETVLAVTTHAHTQTCTQTELDAKRDRILELEAAATRAESALHEAKSASQVALMEARQQLVEDWSVRLTEASSKLQERLSQREQEIASMQVRVTAVACHGCGWQRAAGWRCQVVGCVCGCQLSWMLARTTMWGSTCFRCSWYERR